MSGHRDELLDRLDRAVDYGAVAEALLAIVKDGNTPEVDRTAARAQLVRFMSDRMLEGIESAKPRTKKRGRA